MGPFMGLLQQQELVPGLNPNLMKRVFYFCSSVDFCQHCGPKIISIQAIEKQRILTCFENKTKRKQKLKQRRDKQTVFFKGLKSEDLQLALRSLRKKERKITHRSFAVGAISQSKMSLIVGLPFLRNALRWAGSDHKLTIHKHPLALAKKQPFSLFKWLLCEDDINRKSRGGLLLHRIEFATSCVVEPRTTVQ